MRIRSVRAKKKVRENAESGRDGVAFRNPM